MSKKKATHLAITTSPGPTPPRTPKLVARDTLKAHPYNAPSRIADVRELAKDIADAGMLNPIDVLEDGTMMNGHRRNEAAGELGWTHVYVTVHPHLTSNDWGKFNKSTRSIQGSEWLFAWARSKGTLAGMTSTNKRKCERLKNIFGSFQALEDIAVGGVGVGCLDQIDKITNVLADYFKDQTTGRATYSSRQVGKWLIDNAQTHRARVYCQGIGTITQRHVAAKVFAKAIAGNLSLQAVSSRGRTPAKVK